MNPLAGIPSANVQPVAVLTETNTCCCADLELGSLRDLVAGGMGQMEASRLLWAPVVGQVDRAAFRASVEASFVERHPWLRLGELG